MRVTLLMMLLITLIVTKSPSMVFSATPPFEGDHPRLKLLLAAPFLSEHKILESRDLSGEQIEGEMKHSTPNAKPNRRNVESDFSK